MTVEPLTIDGFQVLFPFKPYDIQVEYMKSVIQCLQQKSNGLLESPTGTGKTLCILCATLGWLDKKRMDTFRRVAAAKTGTEMNGKHGTLAPIHSFEAEMDMKFPVKLQNNHIIGANQLAIINISQSRDKVVLTSKYDNRDNMDYYRALGQTLIDILKTIPKGVLVFFSSYTALNKCTQIWKQYRNDNIWDKLNAVKQLFLEPRAKHAFNECFLKYKQKVDETQSNGAVFFGVFRGKLSEGIDLPDDYCRGVIMTGLPFPAVMDPRVILKKEYLNEAKIPLTADGWYALQMKRALNQAIGRVVRHKDDYGVIILLDSRFASLSDGLSKWVVKYIYRANVNNLDVNLTKLKSFFTNRINTHVVQTTPAETVAAKAFNSQFKPFSQQKKVTKSSPKMNSAINRFTQKNTILDAFKGASSPSVSTFNPTKPKSIFDSMSIIMNKTINSVPKPVVNSSSNGSTTTIIEEITLDEESPRKKRLKFNVALKSIADPTLEDNCSPTPVSRQLSNESNSLAKKTPLNGNTTSVVDLEPIRVDPDEDAEEIICIPSSSSSSSSCVANSVITASKTSTISSRDDNEIKCLSDTSNSTANIKTQSSASIQDFWRKNGAEICQ
ncbi:unnamed protein product [Medioppia subpectinata]|uniref:Regulator of telomere elongation helicase 1 homolog n=2 Tax=Medioppia subpectinata TaxID=1979941 RepID=A0A7R9KMH5_9ACAR|nr:unnamed protein product [Medioppia subpectinata]CAG2106338.1 unnamed protein product [Medioppia subpectinata]